MEHFEHVRVAASDGIATIVLDRSEKLNAMNQAMRRGLSAAMARVRGDPAVRVAVLTGAGDRAFCAGADVTEFAGRSSIEQRRLDQDAPRIFEELEALGKPVICAINGLALGGGCELALACDVRIASETATIGLVEVNYGLIPGGGGTQRLPRLVGVGRALQLILTADPIPAHTALNIGLVEEVVPAGALMASARTMAARMARHSPLALRAAKDAVRATMRLSLQDGLRHETDLFVQCLASEETQRRVAEFQAGRRPDLAGER